VRAPWVVTGWSTALFGLFLIMVGFGPYDADIPVYLFGSSVGLLELIGGIAWLILRRHEQWATRTPALTKSTDALMLALVACFAGASLVWRPWLLVGAFYPGLILLLHAADHVLSKSDG
jgi:hypothetical protein